MSKWSCAALAGIVCVFSLAVATHGQDKKPAPADERAKAIDAIIASLEKLQATGASYKDVIAQLDVELKQVTARFEASARQAADAGKTLAEKKKAYEKLMADTKAARDKLKELEGRLAAAKAEVDKLAKSVTDARGKQAGVKKRIEAIKTSIALLEKIDAPAAAKQTEAAKEPAQPNNPAPPAKPAPAKPGLSAEQLAVAQAGLAVLQSNCLTCHGKNDKYKSGLDLRTRQTVLKGGDRGPAVVAGKSAESLLVKVMQISRDDETDDVPHMPPKKDVSAEDIEKVKKWIDGGAPYPAPLTPAGKAEPTQKAAAPKQTTDPGEPAG